MKKHSKILLITVMLLLLCPLSALAGNYTSSVMGISFTLSDSWQLESDGGDSMFYTHKYGENEAIGLYSVDFDATSIDDFSSDEWKSFCDSIYSNENLASSMVNETTGARANAKVTSDSAPITGYETYNGIKYFRYEKAYTASGVGYNNTAFDDTCFLTVQGGKLYSFDYSRKTISNNFRDFSAMLDTMSFDNVIKITVNGERVYPDSDPVIAYGRTLVPIRAIAEKMGYTVSWNGEYKLVTMTSYDGNVTLHFGIGDYTALRSSGASIEQISLDVPPAILSGRTYLPVRAVAEAMNATVNWNAGSRTVEITY